MTRLSKRHGISRGLLWSLLYRPPKDIMLSKYVSLQTAYIAECERQANALRLEFEITQAKSLCSKALVRAAAAVAGEEDGSVKENPAGRGRG